jgi:hypothetical protein
MTYDPHRTGLEHSVSLNDQWKRDWESFRHEIQEDEKEMRMKKKLLLGIWVGLLLITAGCAGTGQNGSGAVLMIPYTNETLGISANVPLNWGEVDLGVFVRAESDSDLILLQIQKIPDMSLEEVKTLASTDLGLDRFPESFDRYSSAQFEWELFELEFSEQSVGHLKSLVGLSGDESNTYAVLVGTLEKDYDRYVLIIKSVFDHSLYSFRLLE